MALTVPALAAARFVLETAAWFTMHRHRDPDPVAIDDVTARQAVLAELARRRRRPRRTRIARKESSR